MRKIDKIDRPRGVISNNRATSFHADSTLIVIVGKRTSGSTEFLAQSRVGHLQPMSRSVRASDEIARVKSG